MAVPVRTSCPACGVVHVTTADVALMLCNTSAALSYYSFICPTCGDVVRKDADAQTAKLLVGGGVKPTTWKVPAEALEVKTGPALTYDDLLDLCLGLERPGDIVLKAARSVGTGS